MSENPDNANTPEPLDALRAALDETLALFEGTGVLPARRDRISALRDDLADQSLRVGVVGITSSGKSTFINAMMGEQLLPEESRATTNLLVRCRRWAEREALIQLRDQAAQTRRGEDLNAETLLLLASETYNPRNIKDVEALEWRSPRAAFPAELTLMDTPGLDAYGLPEHQELILRRFLPLADIVLYMTSIRNPFKQADLELIETLIDNDQRALFVLSQTDLECDDVEGGRVIRSREDKLQEHYRQLESDIRQHTNLKSYGIVTVSSRLARLGFDDRDSEAWRQSNFGAALEMLERLQKDLRAFLLEARGRRLLALLNTTARELAPILDEKTRGAENPETGRTQERIELLSAKCRLMDNHLADTQERWGVHFDTDRQTEKLRARFEAAEDSETIRELYDRYCGHWATMSQTLTTQLDEQRAEFRQILDQFHITPDRRDYDPTIPQQPPPDLEKFIDSHTETVKARDWGWRVNFWPKFEKVTVEDVRRDELIAGMVQYMSALLPPLKDHLSWWSRYIENVYMEPLRQELASEQQALADLEALRQATELKAQAISALLGSVESTSKRLAGLIADTTDYLALRAAPAPTETPIAAVAPAPAADGPRAPAAIALGGLIARFHEVEFQRVFAAMLAEACPTPAQERRQVLFLGLQRMENIRILSLLAHTLNLPRNLTDIPEDVWIACGPVQNLDLPFPVYPVLPPKTILNDMTLVIAPGDTALPETDWAELLDRFDNVCVSLNAGRIASGVSDLDRAPYSQDLLLRERGVAFVNPNGALFAHKLEDLLVDVVETVRQYLEVLGHTQAPPWFIHENYDARFTHFMSLAMACLDQDASPEHLVSQWKTKGLALYPPFTEQALKDAMTVALQKKYRRLRYDHK